MFDHTLLDKRQFTTDSNDNDPNSPDQVFDGFHKMEPEKRLFRGSMDSGFIFSRGNSRSNSIHAGQGFSLFTNEPGAGTPYRNSPADVPLSPYASSIDIITPLDLVNMNVAVPIPSKAVTGPKAAQSSTSNGHPAERSPKAESRDSSDSENSQRGSKKETGLINELIERFLEEQPISKEEWESITREEQIILDCLIKRKLGFDILEYIKCKGQLKEGQVKCKRLEENYKMVFKGALKYLSSNFKEKKGKKKSSKAEDIAFYQHYFGQVASDGNPLETFYHPNKKLKATSNKNSNNQKTMNSTYLENLLSSERFRQGLETYLNTDFVKGYKMRRRKKIDNFIEKLKKDKHMSQDHQRLADYLENNPKCKLPWSNKELQAAKDCVLQLIRQKKEA
jgi:hypothetical protein